MPPVLRRPLPLTSLGLVLVVAVTTIACTGGDDAAGPTGPTEPSSWSSPPTSAPATTATPTVAPTTTTTVPPPPSARRVEVTGLPDDIDISTASDLLAPQQGRGHILVGMSRRAGSPAMPATWDSPDGINWDLAPAPAGPEGGAAGVEAAAYTDGGLALAGWQSTTDGGQHAALWIASDGRNFSTPAELPAADRRSAIEAVADTDAGLMAAGWVDDGSTRSPLVAVRSGDGTWTDSAVPDLADVNLWDIAAAGATVVIVGNDPSVTPRQAIALVSTDGGATFGVADTTTLAGAVATNLGAVAATPSGFVAVACAPTPTGTVVALARSADGRAWTRQDIALPSDQIGLDNAQCDSLAVDGDVTYVGSALARAWLVTVQPDGQATATRIPQRPKQVAAASPLVVSLGGGQLVAVSRDDGGFSGATLPAGIRAVGLPFGAPSIEGVEASTTSSGIAVRVRLFPEHSGVVGRAERWGPYSRWFTSGDGTSIDFDAPVPDTMEVVVATPFGDVGVGSAEGDAEDESAFDRGAVEGFVRAPGGSWEPVGLVVTGPGRELLLALGVTASGTVIGAGAALGRDADDRQVRQPLIRSTADGRTWATETITGAVPADASLQSVCPRPDGTVSAFGTQTDGVTNRAFGVQRAVDGTWSMLETVDAETDAVACVVTPRGRTILRLAGSDRPSILVSDDGTNFAPADLSAIAFTEYDIAEIAAAPRRLVAVGTARGEIDLDSIVVTSDDDGDTWQDAGVEGLAGLGDQRANGVVVSDDGDLLVVGTDNGAPAGWLIPSLD